MQEVAGTAKQMDILKAQIATHEESIASKDKELRSLHSQVAKKEGEIRRKEVDIEGQELELEKVNSLLSSTRNALTHKEQIIEQLNGQLSKATQCLTTTACSRCSESLIPAAINCASETSVPSSLIANLSVVANSLSTVDQITYSNMSPDALSLLEKLPEGSIEGVHYDSMAGRVLIDKETPQLEDERVSKFQAAYQSIIKKMKIVSIPVPPAAASDAVDDIVDQYNSKYDQCAFLQEGGGAFMRIISCTKRQHDQAKHLLSQDFASADLKLYLSDDRTLTLKKADIVNEEVDTIVSPSNSRLVLGGGVAKALDQASGGTLQTHLKQLMKDRKKEVPAGEVVATQCGGSLNCKFVLHAVGPTAKYKQADCERLLSSVVSNALMYAEDNDVESISIPAISTGMSGVDRKLAARCIVDTIEKYHFTKPHPVLSDIRIVIIDDKTHSPFADYFQQKLKAIKKLEAAQEEPSSSPSATSVAVTGAKGLTPSMFTSVHTTRSSELTCRGGKTNVCNKLSKGETAASAHS